MPIFTPDSKLVENVAPSPNHGDRRGGAIDMIVLHYTGMADEASALAKLCSAQSEVSAHYYVRQDGRIAQCVPEARRAWHAGVACWDGKTDINSCSIGIEIVNPGHDFDYPDFEPGQVEAVIALCCDIVQRHAIPPDRVLAHSDVAPDRKMDPGEKFPWGDLHRAGVGHWVPPHPIGIEIPHALEASGADVTRLQSSLAAYGYCIAVSGRYDERTRQVVAAFQRHFRPQRTDGVADLSTVNTLRDLLTTRPIITHA
jgi:N-acetylmuramoyl-L-alanine amidase